MIEFEVEFSDDETDCIISMTIVGYTRHCVDTIAKRLAEKLQLRVHEVTMK
jgi:hypothetical protein